MCDRHVPCGVRTLGVRRGVVLPRRAPRESSEVEHRLRYPSTVMLRMLRIIPAFSVGGVVNSNLRQELPKQIDYEIPKSWGIL